MCYDVSFTVDIKQLSDYFPDLVYDSAIHMEFGPAAHVQGAGVFGKYPVVYIDRTDFRVHCRLMEWSCIPYYAKEEPGFQQRSGMLNIRSERVLDDKTSYWYKIKGRRCLMPVTGIFEHREVPGWKKKVPYFVKPAGQEVFYLPGLYSVAELPDKSTGELIKRFTFAHMTRAANDLMKMIHNAGEHKWRMPLFLPLDLCKKFLREDLSLEEYQDILDYEIPSEELQYYTVDTIRSPKPRGDGKEKNEPFEWKNLPELSLA